MLEASDKRTEAMLLKMTLQNEKHDKLDKTKVTLKLVKKFVPHAKQISILVSKMISFFSIKK